MLIAVLHPPRMHASGLEASGIEASEIETSIHRSTGRTDAMPDVPVIRVTEISATIHPPLDVDPPDRFGVAVAIDGARVFVGNDGRRDGPHCYH